MTTKTTTYSIQGKASFQSKISGGACSACVVVRRFLLFLLLSALLTPLSTLFSACGHDDLVPPDVYVEEPTTPYVEVRIAIPYANPSSTRANPIGGEDGNGREQGIINEDIVHDINIFFYKADNGLKGDASTPIEYHIYFNTDNLMDEDNTPLSDGTEPIFDKHYLSLKFDLVGKLAELGEGTHFAAIANIGKIDSSNIKNLGDLRNLNVSNYSGAWSKTLDAFSSNASNMDYFLMSTAYNSDYRGTGTNILTEYSEGQLTGTTTLERMYSRIDLWYNKDKNAIKQGEGDDAKVTELKYCIEEEVKDSDGNPIIDEDGDILKESLANVYLTNVLPVNVMKNPSYLFKKVTQRLTGWDKSTLEQQNSDALINWAGIEAVNDDGMPVNYVLERHTTDKQIGGNTPTTTLKNWYGKTAVEYVSGKSKFKSDTAASDDTSGSATTTDLDCSIKNTGIGELSGYFHGTPASSSDQAYGCNQIAIISYANENTHPTDCFHSNYLTGMAFRAVYIPSKIYTTSDASDENTVSITDNISKIYRYSKSVKHDDDNPNNQLEAECIYFSKYEDAKTYSDNHPADLGVITTYDAEKHTIEDGSQKWGFICYYNLWLRHYNNEGANPQETYPMEYATVRNNIYRVAISFSGPGDPEPTMREPDTMKARIFVRKWNYREESEIIF